MSKQWANYTGQKITADLIRKVAACTPPASPKEIHDTSAGLILRHQPSGYLGIYVLVGHNKRERPFGKKCDARRVLDPSSALTLGAIRAEAMRLRGEGAGGRDFQGERAADRAVPTLTDYLDRTYQPWVVAKQRDGQGTVDRIRACFVEKFGKDKLSAITAARIEQWALDRVRVDGVTHETVNRDVDALRPMFNRAAKGKDKIITTNPLAGVERLETDKRKRVIRALTPGEEQQLRAALAARDERKAAERSSANEWRRVRDVEELPSLAGLYADALTPAVLTSIETGLRRSELFALTWPNVDFADKLVRVEGVTAKSYQTREIPLNSAALSVLRRWWMQLGQPKAGFVFGEGEERLASLRKSFANVLKAADIKRTKAGKITWHSLRHSFGSRLGAVHTDAVALRDLMGHADISTTNRYLHSDAERRRQAVERMADEA